MSDAPSTLRHPIGVSLFNHMHEAMFDWLKAQDLGHLPASEVVSAQLAVTMELIFVMAGGKQDYQRAVKHMRDKLLPLSDSMYDLLIREFEADERRERPGEER